MGPETITPIDIFPPAVPSGLTASVGIGAVELAWNRNTEADFKEYRVLRSEEGGPFVEIARGLDAPVYSDHAVQSGKHYRYQVLAVDQNGQRERAVRNPWRLPRHENHSLQPESEHSALGDRCRSRCPAWRFDRTSRRRAAAASVFADQDRLRRPQLCRARQGDGRRSARRTNHFLEAAVVADRLGRRDRLSAADRSAWITKASWAW